VVLAIVAAEEATTINSEMIAEDRIISEEDIKMI